MNFSLSVSAAWLAGQWENSWMIFLRDKCIVSQNASYDFKSVKSAKKKTKNPEIIDLSIQLSLFFTIRPIDQVHAQLEVN